jgi:hypothetical protein
MAVMEREQRPTWTEERLDDLNKKVDDGFGDMRTEFRTMRGEMSEEFRATREEMAAGRRTLTQMAAGIWITAVVGFLGVIATVITHS